MQTNRIDLRMYSFYNDNGERSPRELVGECLGNGIEVMAIANYNSVRANEQGKEAIGDARITYIPAVEIDCTYEGVNFYVLGYGIDYTSPDLVGVEDNIPRQKAAASVEMLHTTETLGFEVADEEIAALAGNSYWKNRWIGEMFVEILLDKTEYKEHPMLTPYRQGGKRGDNPYVNFYWDYYSQGKLRYAEVKYPGLGQIVKTIHGNGGYTVFAHSGVNSKGHEELLRPLIEAGLSGIEAFSSYHSREQALDFYNQTRDHSLPYTCGSDYHGKTKPPIYAGQRECVVPYEEVLGQLSGLCQYHR